MPATSRALALTDAYRAELVALRLDVLRAGAAAWALVNVDELAATYAAWRTGTAAVLERAQRHGAQLAEAYFAAFLAAELDRPVLTAPSSADEVAGVGRDGRPLLDVLTPAIATVAMSLAQGRGREQALAMGKARAIRTLSAEVLAAPRTALDRQLTESSHVLGWRRTTSSSACLACLGAATGALHASAEVLAVHGHCRCTKEPVVRGVRERHRRPTGRDQFDALSPAQQDARYGPKAELVRSGAVALEQLVKPQPMATVPDEITEAPLKALTT
jgi:hypothetical protein